MKKPFCWLLIVVLLLCGSVERASGQNIVVKTNVPQWGLGTVNLAAEVGLAPKWTAELSYSLNHRDNLYHTLGDKQLDHWLAVGEARYWLCDRFYGHFFGLHVMGGEMNINQVRVPFGNYKKDFRYEGPIYMGGISYGYSFILGRRFNMEAEIGLGVAHSRVKKYDCATCGAYKTTESKTYFTPTRIAVNLIYVIK